MDHLPEAPEVPLEDGPGESRRDPPGVLVPCPGDVPDMANDVLDGGVVIGPTEISRTRINN